MLVFSWIYYKGLFTHT